MLLIVELAAQVLNEFAGLTPVFCTRRLIKSANFYHIVCFSKSECSIELENGQGMQELEGISEKTVDVEHLESERFFVYKSFSMLLIPLNTSIQHVSVPRISGMDGP